MAKKFLVVNLYPHTLVYVWPLILLLKNKGFEVHISIRTFEKQVGDSIFSINDGKLFKKTSKDEQVLILDLDIKGLSIFKTPTHEFGPIYLLKYFLRPLRNVLSKNLHEVQDQFFTKQYKNLSIFQRIIFHLMKLPSLNLKFLKFLRLLEKSLPPSKRVLSYVTDLDPNFIFVSPANWENRNYFLSPEIEFIKCAKFLNIKSIVYQLSFDNFFAREIIHIQPDYIFSWLEKSLLHIFNVSDFDSKCKGIVTGPLYLEERFKKINSVNGSRYSKPKKENYFVYLGSASGIISYDEEIEFVEKIRVILKNHNTKVFYRPHPNNIPVEHKLDKSTFLYGEEMSNFYNFLMKSNGVIGVSTTLLYESYLLGVPVFFNNLCSYDIDNDYAMSLFKDNCYIISDFKDIEKFLLDFKNKPSTFPSIFDKKNLPSVKIFSFLKNLY